MDIKPNHNASVFGKIAKKYTKQYFNDQTDFPYIDRFLNSLLPKGKVLDVACGPGMLTKYILNKGFRAEGIDLSPEMLAIARQKVPSANFQVMDMRALDYPAQHFDGIVVAYGLIYLPSSELGLALKGFYRILKPGGSIFLINQEGEPDHEEHESMKPDETLYVNFFTPQSISDALSKASFTITSQTVMPTDNPDVMARAVIYTLAKKPT